VPPHVVLLTIDTIRPDALGCYGGPVGVSPHLDALAEESVIYTAARTTAPITAPAHSSMLTGLYPPRHRVRDNGGTPLPDSALTLAELAREAGYETAAFVAARVLNRATGLDQGFETYDEPPRPQVVGHHYARRPAVEVVNAALAWLEPRGPERPFLLWLHFFDPHQPSQPAPEFLRQANGDPYHGEVAGMDAQIGRFLGALRSRGLMDETVVLVVGDHGEAFGEHGEETHGAYCYDSTLRVPFLVRHPDGRRAGERSDETVSVADVFPTLVEAMGLAPEDGVDGRSLWRGPVEAGRGVYVESYYGYTQYGWSPIAGWVQGGRKYLHSSAPELYDLVRDPTEQANLDDDVEPFRRAIEKVAARPALESSAPAAGEERLEELAALGYATGGSGGETELPHPLAETGRPSPVDSRPEQELIDRASALAQTGGQAEAIRIYRQILADNPANPTALQELSFLLLGAARYQEAISVLKRRLEIPPERGITHAKLGSCYEAVGRLEEAIVHLRRAVELAPNHVRMHEHLIGLLQRNGRAAEAQPYVARLKELKSNP
jgi:arylsulfatase A-like enzyme